MEIIIDFLGGDKQAKFMNEFMHAGDVFEPGKQFAIHERFTVTGNDSVNLEKLCERVADAYKKADGYAVFVGIRTIDGKRPENSYAWFMKGVQSISMKQKSLGWATFKSILEQLGYEVETDDSLIVTKIK